MEISDIGVRISIHHVSTINQAKLEIRLVLTVAFLILTTRCHQHFHTRPKKPMKRFMFID